MIDTWGTGQQANEWWTWGRGTTLAPVTHMSHFPDVTPSQHHSTQTEGPSPEPLTKQCIAHDDSSMIHLLNIKFKLKIIIPLFVSKSIINQQKKTKNECTYMPLQTY